jgi:hypothetical protein
VCSSDLDAAPYNPFPSLNPLHLWVPYPLFNVALLAAAPADPSSLLSQLSRLQWNGLGLFSLMMDSTNTNTVFLEAGFDARHLMLQIDSLTWTNQSLGFPLSLNLADSADASRRRSVVQLSGSWQGQYGRLHLQPSFSLGFAAQAQRPSGGRDWVESAYTWPYEEFNVSAGLGFSLGTSRRYIWELFGRGWNLGLGSTYSFQGSLSQGLSSLPIAPSLDASFSWSWENEILPLRLSAAAALRWPKNKPEFSLAAALGLGLFNWEVQDNLSWLYLNRLQGKAFINTAGTAILQFDAVLFGGYLSWQALVQCRIPLFFDDIGGNEWDMTSGFSLNL